MTVFIEADAFTDALKRVAPAIDPRAQLPILSGVRLSTDDGRLHLVASSFDVTIATSVAASGDIDCVVPHRRLSDFVARCSGKVGLGIVEGELVAEAGSLDLRLRPLALEDWPNLPVADGDALELDETKTATLRGLLYAAGTDQNRVVLTGLKIAENGAACTDSYRLAAVEETFPVNVLVPAAPLAAVLEGAVTIQGNGRHVSFASNGTTTTIRALKGDYPNYRKLIRAESPVTLEADRVALLEAVKTVAPFGPVDKDRGTVIRLAPDGDHVYVCGRSQDVGEARGKVAFTGNCDFEFGVTARYFRELLESVDVDTVRLDMPDALKPIQVVQGNVTHLLMPQRLG